MELAATPEPRKSSTESLWLSSNPHGFDTNWKLKALDLADSNYWSRALVAVPGPSADSTELTKKLDELNAKIADLTKVVAELSRTKTPETK